MTFRLEISDFGPVARARVELHPLTIFVGPNNTGKSTLAMLLYAVTGAPIARVARGRVRTSWVGASRPFYLGSRVTAEMVRAMEDQIVARRETGKYGDLRTLAESCRGFMIGFLSYYASTVITEIERSFGTRLHDMPHTPNGSTLIRIEHDDPNWVVAVGVKNQNVVPGVELNMDESELVSLLASLLDAVSEEYWQYVPPEEFLHEINSGCIERLLSGLPNSRYYLPAARSGLLQSHRLLASVLVTRASLVGIEDMAIPKMSGVISDFLSHLLTLESRRRSDFDDVAKFLESAVIGGSVDYKAQATNYPEISYRVRKQQFPLHRTSSMVSELAPVILFLRHLLSRSELLILEEPESHLHPASQIAFARAIGRLVGRDVSVVITTHSDYFLTQLNNLISAARLDDVSIVGLDRAETLLSSSVAAYNFCMTEAGTVVEELPVDADAGITAESFVNVNEQLYDQMVRLERAKL